jgi:hypothetical protein
MTGMDQRAATRLRTLWFLLAMVPAIFLMTVLVILSLVVTSPLIVYAKVFHKHLKDPRRSAGLSVGRSG